MCVSAPQFCNFSLQEQPEEFKAFLHSATDVVSPSSLTLNALVQDLLRGMSVLHARHIVHCDLKPGNALVSFNRGGKQHKYAPENFHLAQLVIADFGVSRLFAPSETATATTTMTQQTSMTELDPSAAIAGTESFMSPEMIKLMRSRRGGGGGGGGPAENVDERAFLANDAFGCGCTLAILCTGIHPFTSLLFPRIADNIVAFHRLPLRQLHVRDPRHEELIDKLTRKDPATRWTVQQAVANSSVFHPAGDNDMDESRVLLDAIDLRTKPAGSCQQELLSPSLVAVLPNMRSILYEDSENIHDVVERVRSMEGTLPRVLDEDS